METVRAYASVKNLYIRWCREQGEDVLLTDARLSKYIVHLARRPIHRASGMAKAAEHRLLPQTVMARLTGLYHL